MITIGCIHLFVGTGTSYGREVRLVEHDEEGSSRISSYSALPRWGITTAHDDWYRCFARMAFQGGFVANRNERELSSRAPVGSTRAEENLFCLDPSPGPPMNECMCLIVSSIS